MSKAKAQGTAWESQIVKLAKAAGLLAERRAEGGSQDIGDVRLFDARGEEWVIEAKASQAESIHPLLAKTVAKAGNLRAAVIWKRYQKVEGSTRRTTSTVVAIPLAEFLYLLSNQERKDG